MRDFLMGTAQTQSSSINFSLLLLRIYFGLSMVFAHGLGKLPPSLGFINSTKQLGFPLPEIFAWAAGLSEFVGGLFIALGLFTRPSAFFLAITMGVAAFLRHGPDSYSIKEKAILYFVVAIALLITGSGKYGIDGMFQQSRRY
ncbi:DoxX family protein [Flammeovirgaceae bacterium SG7u.111]|nr:DoxX family protein [Flammeovirgaceae bacterium SG7u.132]WPO37401.1 DoxX family protein [Flammeovirgaceae bacterium SG7u.111]